jgi:hypothetical protein
MVFIYISMSDLTKLDINDFITIETHFGVPEHFIRADTRNGCSEDLVAILSEISTILYPDEIFDIYLLPPEPGSYKDIVKFVKRNKVGSTVGAVIAVGSLVLGSLNYRDSHEAHIHDKKAWIVDDVAKCIELKKMLEEMQVNYNFQNIPEDKIQEVCGNINIKKKKNSFYNHLKNDGMILNNELNLVSSLNQNIYSSLIDRRDFNKYIEPINDTKYSTQNNEGVIELISPVVKQEKEGKGISWKGVYYGDSLYYRDISILNDGDRVDFFMQDKDFKEQISSKERTFAVGDSMKVIFDITGELKGGAIVNRAIYIKSVASYNEDIIPHRERVLRKKQAEQTGQNNTLFDNI